MQSIKYSEYTIKVSYDFIFGLTPKICAQIEIDSLFHKPGQGTY